MLLEKRLLFGIFGTCTILPEQCIFCTENITLYEFLVLTCVCVCACVREIYETIKVDFISKNNNWLEK